MTYTATKSDSYSYTILDIEVVVRRFAADIAMIAQSSNAITEVDARNYTQDIEVLAKNGYLRKVDLTLLSAGTEIRATQYVVNTAAGNLMMSRPGGVMWPRVANPYLRIVLSYTDSYDTAAREAMKGQLKIGWVPTTANTSHATLLQSRGRDYASNGWGMQRTDFAT